MSVIRWIIACFYKNSNNGKLDSTVLIDSGNGASTVAAKAPDCACSDIDTVKPPSPKMKDTSRIMLRADFEASSTELQQKQLLARKKLDHLDDVLTKKLEEKNGGEVYGYR